MILSSKKFSLGTLLCAYSLNPWQIDTTFPFNNVQYCRIPHVTHVWPPREMMLDDGE